MKHPYSEDECSLPSTMQTCKRKLLFHWSKIVSFDFSTNSFSTNRDYMSFRKISILPSALSSEIFAIATFSGRKSFLYGENCGIWMILVVTMFFRNFARSLSLTFPITKRRWKISSSSPKKHSSSPLNDKKDSEKIPNDIQKRKNLSSCGAVSFHYSFVYCINL
jgi:hypothetical protein